MPKIGPIVAIRAGSPAASAGLAVGDVIEAIDGKPPGAGDGEDSWEAATLPEYLQRAAAVGREVELTLRRRPSNDAEAEQAAVRLTPAVPIQFNSPFPPRSTGTPMAAEAAGFAYRLENEVAAVSPGSGDTALNITPGDIVTAAKVVFAKSGDAEALEPVSFDFAQDKSAWASLLDAIQFAADGTVVQLTVQNGDASEQRQVELKPVTDDSSFVTARGFWFGPLERIRKAESFAEQVRYGWDETTESLTMVFRFLQKLGSQVPITALGGPVTIAKAAGYSAAEGLPSLLVFLTMLSANLAVINFLPIPVLDGGHMVFLAYEWIRGRPANEKFVVAMHTAGFVLIVSLMLYVLALDFNLIDRNL
jgi:regulator of sigma E protease